MSDEDIDNSMSEWLSEDSISFEDNYCDPKSGVFWGEVTHIERRSVDERPLNTSLNEWTQELDNCLEVKAQELLSPFAYNNEINRFRAQGLEGVDITYSLIQLGTTPQPKSCILSAQLVNASPLISFESPSPLCSTPSANCTTPGSGSPNQTPSAFNSTLSSLETSESVLNSTPSALNSTLSSHELPENVLNSPPSALYSTPRPMSSTPSAVRLTPRATILTPKPLSLRTSVLKSISKTRASTPSDMSAKGSALKSSFTSRIPTPRPNSVKSGNPLSARRPSTRMSTINDSPNDSTLDFILNEIKCNTSEDSHSFLTSDKQLV